MDDSRSVLQAPAEMSVSGHFLPSRSTQTSPFLFFCRLCGGRDFTVATIPGVEVELASLLAYQTVGKGDFSGTTNLYTCVRCAASVRDAHEAVRGAILNNLVVAARALAENQFTRPGSGDRWRLMCAQCRTLQTGADLLDHASGCRVGRVLALCDSLAQLERLPAMQQALRSGAADVREHFRAGAAKGGAR